MFGLLCPDQNKMLKIHTFTYFYFIIDFFEVTADRLSGQSGWQLTELHCHALLWKRAKIQTVFLFDSRKKGIKVHIFWEGHKNMTKSPKIFWQNGLLSKVGCNWGHGLWAAAHFFKKSKKFEKNLLRRPSCQKKFGDFVIFLWPSQNIWTLIDPARLLDT